MARRTMQELLDTVPELKALDEENKNVISKSNDVNQKADFIIRVVQEIVTGIEAGNFYNFDDACTIANYFGAPDRNWTHYGCSIPYDDCMTEDDQ